MVVVVRTNSYHLVNRMVAERSGHFSSARVCYVFYNGSYSQGLNMTIPAGMTPLAEDIMTTRRS